MNNFISISRMSDGKSIEEIQSLLENFDLKKLPKELSGIINTTILASIIHYRLKNKDPLIYKFCQNLTNKTYSLNRYMKYKEYRTKNLYDSRSIEYYKLKYGEDWELFYNQSKSNRPNPYDIKHYIKKGYSLVEAEKAVIELKSKTAPSLEKYIEKYGEQEGKIMFQKSCRLHKNYLDFWISKSNGDLILAKENFEKYKRNTSKKCVEFYTKRGYTQKQATQMISEHQKKSAGVHREYYVLKGYSDEEINLILKSINCKKDSASIEFIRQKYPEVDPYLIYREHNKTKSSRYRSKGVLAKDDPEQDKRDQYYLAVYYYTRQNKSLLEKCPGKPGRTKGSYHIDHIYSIDEGYKTNIEPEIIGSVVNLRWLPAELNSSKRQKSDISKEALLRKYKDYENKKNNQTLP
jgi:hypothetical protein